MKRLRRTLQYALIQALIHLARALPYRLTLAAGRLLGALAFAVARRDRRRAVANAAAAFPSRDARALARASFVNLGLAAAEAVRMRDTLARHTIRLDAASRAALDAALAHDRGVLFVTAHLGNWELLAAHLASIGVPAAAVVRPSYDPRIDALVAAHRAAYGLRTIRRDDPRALIRALDEGRAVGLLLDQDMPGPVRPFLGRPARIAAAPARLAARRGIPVVVGAIRRAAPAEHAITVTPVAPTVDAIAAALDAAVRAAPEQWVWMHDRWRSNPRTTSLPRDGAVI